MNFKKNYSGENLTERLVYNINDFLKARGLEEEVSLDSPSKISLIDFKFEFSLKKNNLEILIIPPEEVKESFIKTLERIDRKALSGSSSYKRKRRKYSKYLKKRGLKEVEDENYVFRATLPENRGNPLYLDTVSNAIINQVISPIMSFPRCKAS